MNFPFHKPKPTPSTPEERTEALLVAMQSGLLLNFAKKQPLKVADFLVFYDRFEGRVVNPTKTPLHKAAMEGVIDEVAQVLALSGEKLLLEHFLVKSRFGFMPLHAAAWGGHLDQVVEALKPSGQKLTVEALITGKHSGGKTALDYAIQENHLDQVFAPSIWAGRVKEMMELWKHVPEARRGSFDYDGALKGAILASRPSLPKWDAAAYDAAVRFSGVEAEKTEFFPGKTHG